MIVRVKVHGCEIKVPVGDGTQTFKWLGQVLQARIAAENLLESKFGPKNVVVTGLKNTSGQLIDPMDRLCEHLPSESSTELGLSAEIVTEFETDNHGNPTYSDWLRAAYLLTEPTSRWAFESQIWLQGENLRKEVESSLVEYDVDVDDDRSIAKAALNKRHTGQHSAHFVSDSESLMGDLAHSGSLVQIGGDFTEAEIAAAFNLDWSNMNFSWIAKFTELNKIAVYDTLKEHYGVICNLFLHYCGVGKVGQRYGMTLREFEHLLILATGKPKTKCAVVTDKVFSKVIGTKLKKSKAQSTSNLLAISKPPSQEPARYDDFDIDAALANLDTPSTKTPSRSMSKNPSKMISGTMSTSSSVQTLNKFWPLLTRSAFVECLVCYAVEENLGNTIGEAVSVLLTNSLGPYLERLHSTYLKYTLPESSIVVNEYYFLLREAFVQKASVDFHLGPTQSLWGFTSAMQAAQLLIEADGDRGRETALCEEAFKWALMYVKPQQQKMTSLMVDESDMTEDPLGPGDELVFAEFLEGISKIALITMQDESALSDVKKIRIAVNFLVESFSTPTSAQVTGTNTPGYPPVTTAATATGVGVGGSARASFAEEGKDDSSRFRYK